MNKLPAKPRKASITQRKGFRCSSSVKTGNSATLDTYWGKGRFTSMGFGKRWTPLNLQGRNSPSPTAYTLKTTLAQRGVRISAPPRVSSPARASTPGPGAYDIPAQFTSTTCTLKGKIPVVLKETGPPPGSYDPNYSLTWTSRFSKISFKSRGKSAFEALNTTNPGPGSYNIRKSL